jgi:hypothetical protein
VSLAPVLYQVDGNRGLGRPGTENSGSSDTNPQCPSKFPGQSVHILREEMEAGSSSDTAAATV